MIPALFVFLNDTCDTLTLDYGDVYVCSSSVTTVITVTTVIEKTDRAVTIVTIKIGAGLSSLAYLRIEDEKLFAADYIFLSASIFAHKVGFAVHYFALCDCWSLRGKHSAVAPTRTLRAAALHKCGRTRTPYSISERRKLMARKQTERMNLRMTPEEKKMIFERVIQAGCPSINRFVVKMCSEGKIVSNDALREINKELHYQGNNLNQLTRLAHLGEIKVIDLSKLLATYEKLLDIIAKESEKT